MHRKGSEQTREVPSEGRRALKHAGFMLIFACLANELKALRKKSLSCKQTSSFLDTLLKLNRPL